MFLILLRVLKLLEESKGLKKSAGNSLAKHKHTCYQKSCVCCHYQWMNYANTKHLRALADTPCLPPCSQDLRLEPLMTLEISGKPLRAPIYQYTLMLFLHQLVIPF